MSGVRSTRVAARHATSLAVAVALAVTAGCGASKDQTGHGSEYVALGDSYTSAPGMEPVADTSCRRSEINYPSLVAQRLKITSFADRSCGGARLANLEQPQSFKDPQTGLPMQINAPQLNAVGKDTQVVTIGMGLNDQAIATSLLLICITLKGTDPNATCQQYLKRPQSSIEAQIRNVAADLAAALRTIAKKAPDASIVVVGYPRLVPDDGACGSPGQAEEPLPVPAAQVARMRETMRFVDGVWRDTAAKAGAAYVDMYTASQGHDICSDDPWISPYTGVPGKAAGLHPLPAYEQAVADQVVRALGKD
jgi:hypothetical protein